jgi:hypothetical protein
MTIDRINQVMALKDGRTLSFAEYGDLAGEVFFAFPVPVVRQMFLFLGLYFL